jgi:hypothetical protein
MYYANAVGWFVYGKNYRDLELKAFRTFGKDEPMKRFLRLLAVVALLVVICSVVFVGRVSAHSSQPAHSSHPVCGWTVINYAYIVDSGGVRLGYVDLWEYTCDGGVHTETVSYYSQDPIEADISNSNGYSEVSAPSGSYINTKTIKIAHPTGSYGCVNTYCGDASIN